MDNELLNAAIKALSIDAVHLRSSEVWCKEEFIPQFMDDELLLVPLYKVNSQGRLHIFTEHDSENNHSRRTVVYRFAGHVRLVDRSFLDEGRLDDVPEEAICVEISAEFCAHYRIVSDADDDELGPAIQEFGKQNVGYHVWPYWREYVQSACARMGMPPVPVPMYKMARPESKAKAKAKTKKRLASE